jgi:hypothetical protein
MPNRVPSDAAHLYEAGPSKTTVATVSTLQNNVRAILGSSYETLLQGSYKNDTSISDLNDVDIVAIRKSTTSTVFTNTPSTNPISWETIFDEVCRQLEANGNYSGKTTKSNRCIKIGTSVSVDVVPAIEIAGALTDPIAIYSRSEGKERKNSPRMHYLAGIEKQKSAGDRFKPTVRMFKRWSRQKFANNPRIAPSFYIECLISNFVDSAFLPDPVDRFVHIASVITGLNYRSQKILTVAGDKNVLTETEWSETSFLQFQLALRASLT